VGNPAERFEFGAHDFSGGSYETAMQESISGDITTVTDGKLHMVAVVVNQTTLSFWTDAVLQKQISLSRPVTDCDGRAMIAGDANIPRLGEITFFPRQLTQITMSEVMSSGFTFESLATGKEAFKPERTQFDTAASMQASFFADAEGERKEAARELQIENSFSRLVSQAVADPDDDDCFYYHSWRNNVVIAFGTLSPFLT